MSISSSSFSQGSSSFAPFKAPGTFPSNHLQTALAESLSHGGFADVKLRLFSRRLASGRVGKAGAVYANSSVLTAASPYFRGLLAGGFAESGSLTKESDVPSSTDAYDYDSDSDLDDDDIDEEHHDTPRGTINITEAAKERDPASTPTPSISALQSPVTPACERVPIDAYAANSAGVRTITIQDSALNTWQCVVLYLYTGQVTFAPLKSQGLQYRQLERNKYHVKFPHYPLPCSPKSMFRLADILGLDDLSQRAEGDMRKRLSQANIHDELFSTLSSRYKVILDAQVEFFRIHCVNKASLPKLQQKMEILAAGQSSHAITAFMSLFQVWITSNPQEPLTKKAAEVPTRTESAKDGFTTSPVSMFGNSTFGSSTFGSSASGNSR